MLSAVTDVCSFKWQNPAPARGSLDPRLLVAEQLSCLPLHGPAHFPGSGLVGEDRDVCWVSEGRGRRLPSGGAGPAVG